MSMYNYEEAVYASTLYVFGKSDRHISVEEKIVFQNHFMHVVTENFFGIKKETGLEEDVKKGIIERWVHKQNVFFQEITESLKSCSIDQKMAIADKIWGFIKRYHELNGGNIMDYINPLKQLMESIGISKSTLDDHFINRLGDKLYKFNVL